MYKHSYAEPLRSGDIFLILRSKKLEKLLSVKDLQTALSLGHTRVYQLIKSGELSTFKIGRRRMATAADVEKFIEKQRQN